MLVQCRPVRATVTRVTPGEACHLSPHFADSLPPSCMPGPRPVIGWVEAWWWGGCHSEGVLYCRKAAPMVTSVSIIVFSTSEGIGYGCVVVQHAVIKRGSRSGGFSLAASRVHCKSEETAVSQLQFLPSDITGVNNGRSR